MRLLSAYKRSLSAYMRLLNAYKRLLSADMRLLSAYNRLLSAYMRLLSAYKRLLSAYMSLQKQKPVKTQCVYTIGRLYALIECLQALIKRV